MSSIHSSLHLDSHVWPTVEESLIDFDLTWNSQGSSQMDEWVKNLEEEIGHQSEYAEFREAFIAEAAVIDIEHSWKAGKSPAAESYLKDFDLSHSYFDPLFQTELEIRKRMNRFPDERALQQRFGNSAFRWRNQFESACCRATEGLIETENGAGASLKKKPVGDSNHFNAGDRIGRYRLEEVIGQGGFAIVWRARDTMLDRVVAIKVIRTCEGKQDEHQLSRLQREAVAVASIKHPAIADVYEVGESDGRWFIAQQFIEGQGLDKLIRENQVGPSDTVSITRRVAEAVHAANQCGIIHRDIKPANIIVDENLNPFLVDFGLAALVSKEQKTLTQQGDTIGTPCYMAPELAQGNHHQVDCRTDVYSLGAVFFHAITGKLPFEGSIAKILYDVVNKPVEATLATVKQQLNRDQRTIIQRCMEKEPWYRYSSAQDVANELERIQRGEPLVARPVGLPERIGKWIRRKPGLAIALVTFFVLSAGLIGSLIQLQEVNRQRSVAKSSQKEAEATTVEKSIAAGRLAMERGRLTEAVEQLSFASRTMETPDIGVLTDFAESLINIGESSQARDIIATIPKERSQSQDNRIKLLNSILSLETSDEFDNSIRQFEALLETLDNEDEKLFVEAMLSDSTVKATELVKQSIEVNPLSFQSYRLLGLLLFSQARFEETTVVLAAATQLFPEDQDFILLASATLACQGKLEASLDMLDEAELIPINHEAWGQALRDLHFVCTSYTHEETVGLSFDELAMTAISKRFVECVLPEFQKRAFRFPPKIGKKLYQLHKTAIAFSGGKADAKSFMEAITELRPYYQEASLDCWAAGHLIGNRKVELAQNAFARACDGNEFVQATRSFKWIGLAATSVVVVLRGNKDEKYFHDGIRALNHIRNDEESLNYLCRNTNYFDPITSFVIDAHERDLADTEHSLYWINKCEELEVVTNQAHLEWLRAVVHNKAGHTLQALRHLTRCEEIGTFDSPSRDKMRKTLNEELANLGYDFQGQE